MMRVKVKPELLRWARERAGVSDDELVSRFPEYDEWESGIVRPTLNQLKKFSRTVRAPVGYFFLPRPPEEKFPILDFRTMESMPLRRPSPDLLDTIYLCQQRQDWYSDYVRSEGEDGLSFVGSATLADDVGEVATRIRDVLKFGLKERGALRNWIGALRRLIDLADELGVMVMVSGIVGVNTRCKLDSEEFRGFALADNMAPLIFINGADGKSVQMFTLVHELAHIWLGQSALSDCGPDSFPEHEVEAWCSRVAAEFLVPLAIFREEYRKGEDLVEALPRLAHRFKVSTPVILCRIRDVGGLTPEQFRHAYDAELKRLKTAPEGRARNLYRAEIVRAGKRFSRAIVACTLGGRASYTETLRLLGCKKVRTLDKLARQLDIIF